MGRDRRRVVITGMGVIAPNGKDLATFWDSVRGGKSSAGFVRRFDTSKLESKVAAEIHDFEPSHYMDFKMARRLERSLQFSVAGARLAAEDAALDFREVSADRTGVLEATSMSNMEAVLKNKDAFQKRGHRSMSPSLMINAYFGGGSAEISEALHTKASSMSISSSSASGNDVVGFATSMIRQDEADVMIAGGAEAPIVEEVWAGFYMSRAMTRHSDDPKRAMRPFDATRDGFVLGEGAGFMVLEELTHALGRGARIYAEVLGHGRSCEAFHAIAPQPEGEGVLRAMERAFHDAEIDPGEIDYINAHGSATEAGDLAETRAIKHFFKKDAETVAVSSTKPVTGHPMAAAGALETVICALSIYKSEIPMTLNFERPGEECDLDYVGGSSRPYPVGAVLNLNSGFGGKNCALILKRYRKEAE